MTASFDDLDDAALDELPFGVVCLSAAGTVVRYNRAEAERAGIQPWRALGRDFFHEVAGLAAGELEREIARGAIQVRHTFRSYRRSDEAVIEVVPGRGGRRYLRISRAA